MNEREITEALAAETESPTAADDAWKIRDPQRGVSARIDRDAVADSADPTVLPLPKQLAGVARRISTEALSAELAAERGDWAMVHLSYERLALLFAEYRLLYVQCLAL